MSRLRPPSPTPTPNRQFNTSGDPSLMSSDYFKDEDQLTWREDAAERYSREHSIDTRYGGITGPLGPIPAGLAIQYQAAHDQAVWNARNRMGLDALRMAQGAHGLMSSYRAGGGAAIQANTMGNMANLQMQRAQMLSPLDLLGDYRRDSIARAGSAGRSESQWGAALQGIGAILSVAVPGVGTIAGAALAAGGGILGAQGASKAQAAYARAGIGGQTYGGGGGMQSQAFGAAMQAAQGIRQMSSASGTGSADPAYDAAAGSAAGQISPNRQTGFFDDATGAQAPAGEDMGSLGAPGAQDRSMQQGGQQGGQAGSKQVGGGMPPVVGTDGIFTPTAYAANAMRSSPMAPAMQLMLNDRMAQTVAQDPSWSLISMQIDRELQMRLQGAA